MENFFQCWWKNKKLIILFGTLLAAVGVTALIPGMFLRILPVWFSQAITSVSTELISIGIAIVVIDFFSFYQQYHRSLMVLSKFKINFDRLNSEIYWVMNEILFEGNDFFDTELSTVKRLEVFSEQLKEVEGYPDQKCLLAFYRSFLPNVDSLVNSLPLILSATDFFNINEALSELFTKALQLQRMIKTAIQRQDAKDKNYGFEPFDFSEFLAAVVTINKFLAQTPAK